MHCIGFVFYDYKDPENVPEHLLHSFDHVVIDPPFITEGVRLLIEYILLNIHILMYRYMLMLMVLYTDTYHYTYTC